MENLKEIVARVLNIDMKKINDGLSRDNVFSVSFAEEWDSFNHLLLISEIEKEIGVKFTISEVEKIKTFKELREIVSKKKRLE